jgi:hypothetical protein
MDHFATIESAQEYIGKLTESLVETKSAIEAELATIDKRTKRFSGLMIARYKLEQLERLLTKGSKYLNDLRKLEKACQGESPCLNQ